MLFATIMTLLGGPADLEGESSTNIVKGSSVKHRSFIPI